MSERLLRQWVRSCLVEQAQILTIAGTSPDDPEKRYALVDMQAQAIKKWIETGEQPDFAGTGDFWSPVEPYTPENAKEQFVKAFEKSGRSTEAELFKNYVDGVYKSLANKQGGILDTLMTLAMNDDGGVDAIAAKLFSEQGMPGVGASAVEVPYPDVLQPLFDVYEPGRKETMGRGEVLLAFSYANSSATAGGDIDVTIGGSGYHVKDLRGDDASSSDSDIALGKPTDWARDQFPFTQLLKSDTNPGGVTPAAKLGELSKDRMEKGFPGVQQAYVDGKAPVAADPNNPQAVADAFQTALDEVVRNSDSWGAAAGVVFASAKKLYLCGPQAIRFNRTTQNALRISPVGISKFKTPLLPRQAAMTYAAKNSKGRLQDATTIEDVVDEWDTLKGQGEAELKLVVNKLYTLIAKLPDDDPKRPIKGQSYTYRGNLRKGGSKAVLLSNIDGYIDYIKNPPSAEEREKMLEVSHRIAGDLRSLIRENLLSEELTKSDKKEIEKLARKQAMAIMDKEGWDKKEIEKLAKKQAEDAIKKALGVSFIGTKGNINKFVSDVTQDTAEKWLEDKATQQQVADITKKVMKRLYKDLALSSPQIIDRIKV